MKIANPSRESFLLSELFIAALSTCVTLHYSTLTGSCAHVGIVRGKALSVVSMCVEITSQPCKHNMGLFSIFLGLQFWSFALCASHLS